MFTIAALYHFTRFENHLELQKPLQKQCEDLGISGSLLLASEGINGTIAGTRESIKEILVYIKKMPGLAFFLYRQVFLLCFLSFQQSYRLCPLMQVKEIRLSLGLHTVFAEVSAILNGFQIV